MHTVLLIDDDAPFRSTLSRCLADDGWKVLEAEDGEAGLSLAKEHHPPVIVCDLLMPRCNGFQFCRAIRSQPSVYLKPAIVVTSGSAYETDRKNALESGADEYLVKPILPETLSKVLEKHVPQSRLAQPTRRKAGEGTSIRFWGVRGSIPTPGPGTVHYGGNTSCVEVRSDDEIIILDAGTGIRSLGLHLVDEFKDEPINVTLLITHTHWDHIQGFPFFIPAYNPKNHLRILGFDGARKGLESTLSNQMESPYFPISMQQMPGNITIQELRDFDFKVGKVGVRATFMNHPGVCVGYRLSTRAGDVAYLPDNELFQRFKAGDRDKHETAIFARTQDDKLVDFVRDTEVLIIDSQYDVTEYPSHIGWGHSCVEDTVALALRAKVKRLFLFHHDPNHDDAHIRRMAESARALAAQSGADLMVDAAREGIVVELPNRKPAPVPA